MRRLAAILALASVACAEEKTEWALAKGAALRYRIGKTVDGRQGEIQIQFAWEYVVALKVAEVKDGAATMDGTIEAVKYENIIPRTSPCRFDSEKDKGEVEDPLKTYKAAVGGKFRMRARLSGKVEAVEGLDAVFDAATTGHYAHMAIEQFREMVSLVFLDWSRKDEKGYRLGVTVSFVRPGIPVAEDVVLAPSKDGYDWKGTWTRLDTEDAQNWALTDESGSTGRVEWAKGRLKSLKVETKVAFSQPEPISFKLVRTATAESR